MRGQARSRPHADHRRGIPKPHRRPDGLSREHRFKSAAWVPRAAWIKDANLIKITVWIDSHESIFGLKPAADISCPEELLHTDAADQGKL